MLSVGEVDGRGRGRAKVVPGTRFLSQLPCHASSEDDGGETTPSSTSPTENTLSDLPSLYLDKKMATTPVRKLPGKLAGKRVQGTKHMVSQLQMRSALKGRSSPGEVDRQSLNVGLELARTGMGGLRVKGGRGVDASPVSHTLSEGEVPAVIRKQQQQRRRIRVSAEEPGLITPEGRGPASQGGRGGGLGPSSGGGGGRATSSGGEGRGTLSGCDAGTSSTRDGIDVISISSHSEGRLLASLPLESLGTPRTPELSKVPAPQAPQQPEGKLIVVEPTLDAGRVISLRPVAPPTPKQANHVTSRTPHQVDHMISRGSDQDDHVTILVPHHTDHVTSLTPHQADHVTPHHIDHVTEPASRGRYLEVRVPGMGGTSGGVEGESEMSSLSKDSEFNFTSYTLSISTTSLPL